MYLQKNPAKISELAPDIFWLVQAVLSLIYPIELSILRKLGSVNQI